jgi:hypothetical protein
MGERFQNMCRYLGNKNLKEIICFIQKREKQQGPESGQEKYIANST